MMINLIDCFYWAAIIIFIIGIIITANMGNIAWLVISFIVSFILAVIYKHLMEKKSNFSSLILFSICLPVPLF